MKALQSCTVVDVVGENKDFIKIAVDYSRFEEFNRQFERYEPYSHEIKQQALYIDSDLETPFSVTESNSLKLYDRFLKEGRSSNSYVEWLESLIGKDMALKEDCGSELSI